MTTSGGWKFFKKPRKTWKSKPGKGPGGEFKKAGEGAEYLWSKIHKKGAYENG